MITVDKDKIVVTENGSQSEYDIGSKEAFEIISQLWLRSGWDTKYVYSFSWLGRPIIQLPEDMMRIQEVIYTLKPDVILETGIAHGGSLIFYASLFNAIGGGRVIGVDIEIRPHNRKAIETHELFSYITLIEGDSIDENVVQTVKSKIRSDEKVLVILDSIHSKEHVLAELNAYCELVNIGSYIVASDGIMQNLVGSPRSEKDWAWNNPWAAAQQFVDLNKDFVIEEPVFPFNEGLITERVTHWPAAFLKRVKCRPKNDVA